MYYQDEHIYEKRRFSKKDRNNKDSGSNANQNQGYSFNDFLSDVGNQGIRELFEGGLVQAKLNVNKPGDKYEQEADRLAKEIVNKKVIPDENQEINTLHTTTNIGSHSVSNEAELKINNLKGKGRPLDDNLKKVFKPWFGAKLDEVKVHTDGNANELAESINARAFTLRNDIVFGAGEYQPETTEGQELIVHELTHTVQQGNEVKIIQRQDADAVTSADPGIPVIFHELNNDEQQILLWLYSNNYLSRDDFYDNDFINIVAIKKKIKTIQILKHYGEVLILYAHPPSVDWIIHYDNPVTDFLFKKNFIVNLDTCEINYAFIECGDTIAIPLPTFALSFLIELAYSLSLSAGLIATLENIKITNNIKEFETCLQGWVFEYENVLLSVRNPNPIGKRRTFNTRKAAYEAAKRAGGGNEPRGPEDQGHGPHFHPNVDRSSPLFHDHYYFPGRFF